MKYVFNRDDTAAMERFCFDTILKNVLKNRTRIIGLLISVICIAGFSMQVQAQARTRKAVPYMLPLMHRRRRQNAGFQPVGMGMTPSGNSISSTQDSIGVHLVGQWNVGYQTEPVYNYLSVSGNYVYMEVDSTLYVIDVSDPTTPKEVGHYNIGDSSENGGIMGLAVVGHYLYLNIFFWSPNHSELRIVDMSDPGSPREVGSFSYDNNSHNYGSLLSVSDNYAYIGRDSTLNVIDVSDPANPHKVGSAKLVGSYSIIDMYVTNGYVYVATYDQNNSGNYNPPRGLHIIDATDPTKPHEVGGLSQAVGQDSYDYGYGEKVIYVSDGLAYVAGDFDGLLIFDVSDPTKPHEVGDFKNTDTEVYGVYAVGKYAYIVGKADIEGGQWEPVIQILDVSDTANPQVIGTYYDLKVPLIYPFTPSEISVKDGNIYTIDVNNGLYILNGLPSNELSGAIQNVTLDKGSLPTSALSGSQVSVYSGSTLAGQATTGSDGGFQFPNQTDSSYTLRVSANAINELTNQATNLSWDYTVRPTYYSIQVPVGLFNQTYTGAYGLNHLTISSDVLFGLLPPQPLVNSYDPTSTAALLQGWRTGKSDVSASDTNSVYTQRIRALARHLMVQSLYQGEFTNAATMSHSLSTATTQLITTYVLAGKLANKTEEKTSKEVSEVKLANEVNSLVQGIRGQVRSAFLSPVINKVANALPAPYNKYVPLAVGKTLAFFQSDSKKDFLTNMLQNQTQALASTASDEILLSYGYVPATQTGLDRSVKLAHAFDYTGSTGQAFHDLVDTTTSSVLEQSNATTKLVKKIADKANAAGDFTKKSATITQLIAEVAAPTSETGVGAVVAGVAESLTGVLKGTALASYLTSAIAPGLRLVQIAGEANHGVDVAYHPDQQSTFQKIVPEQSGRRYIR